MDSIKQIRLRLHLTQEKMAERLGITRNYLALIETGRRPMPQKVRENAESLCNNVTENPPEIRLPQGTPNTDKLLRELLARLEALDARVSSVERLLLKLLAEPSEKEGKH